MFSLVNMTKKPEASRNRFPSLIAEGRVTGVLKTCTSAYNIPTENCKTEDEDTKISLTNQKVSRSSIWFLL
jgi:hypothetical protein